MAADEVQDGRKSFLLDNIQVRRDFRDSRAHVTTRFKALALKHSPFYEEISTLHLYLSQRILIQFHRLPVDERPHVVGGIQWIANTQMPVCVKKPRSDFLINVVMHD